MIPSIRSEILPWAAPSGSAAIWTVAFRGWSAPTRSTPNYAQAKYSRAWAEALLGSAAVSQSNVDAALALSPLDPLLYGMFGVRAFSHIVLEESAQAADWAERAARSPGAHALIEMIAVVAHGLNGNDARAKAWAESARARVPDLTDAEFFRAFPFRDSRTA